MVGKFSTSRSPTSSAWSSMSIQRKLASGNFFARSKNPGRYWTHVSHHSAQRQFTTTMLDSMHALAGMIGLLAIAWALGEDRRGVPWRAVAAGVGRASVLGGLCPPTPRGRRAGAARG